MASCVRNICTKNGQNLIIGFQVTVENFGDVFLKHSVYNVVYVEGQAELGLAAMVTCKVNYFRKKIQCKCSVFYFLHITASKHLR